MQGLYGRFHDTAARGGSRTAIEVQRRETLESWTYARLLARTEALASSLASRGIGRGDRCAILAENDAHWCAGYLGLLRLGAVPVPLDTSYTAAQVDKLISDSGARTILVSPSFQETALQLDARHSCPPFPLHHEDESADESDAGGPAVEVEPGDTAVMLYTSGTTSDPKGVVLTHGNLTSELDAALSVVTIDEDDAILGVLPLFHALAQLANFLLPLSVGARVVFLDTINSADLMRAFHERDISAFCCVPQFFHLIHRRVMEQVSQAGRWRRLTFRSSLGIAGFLRERLGINLGPALFGRVHRALGPRMGLLVTGGSRLDPIVGRDLYRLGFNLLQAYGLTETSGAATVLRAGDRHVDSVGHALPGVDLKIVPLQEDDDHGHDTEQSEGVGEVAIRGPVVSPGYYRRDDVNAVAFRDGWLHTGDLGYLDKTGRLFITGRAKDVIVLESGKNIYPEEIEAHYVRSPYIKELCVIGRALPGAPASERLHAVVVPDFEVLREKKIFNSRDMLRFEIETLSAELPGHKRILSYDVVTDELPRTTTRKLKRFEIQRRQEQARDADAPEAVERSAGGAGDTAAGESWEQAPDVQPILELLRGMTRNPLEIRRSANLELDLGFDSMGRVELLAAIEGRLGISLPDEVAQEIHTVGELVDATRAGGAARASDSAADFDPWSNLLDQLSDDDPAFAPVLASRPVLSFALFVASKLLYAGAWLLLGLRVTGREHLPQRGPFLISPNHQSFLDAFLLVSTLPYRVFRNTFYVGASEYFATAFRAWIARLIRVVPVDPDSNLVHAMRAGARGLRSGKVLILFPEGERSIDGTVKTFKKGAAILSLRVGAPIVPVALDGMFEMWPRAGQPRWSRLLPFSGARTRIHFGPPLEPAPAERHEESHYASVTDRLRAVIEQMLGRPHTE